MFLKKTEIDKEKSCHEKSINLICMVHKNLIDSYASHNHPKLETKFLMWLFVRLLYPLINFIDKFIQEGVIFDIKSELGFQRNLNITIENPDYWKQGHDLIFKNNTENYNKLPVFMQNFLNNSFNICKYMEVVKLISNFAENSDIYARFLSLLFIDCPYLKNHSIQEDLTQSEEKASPKINLVEINFKNLEHHSSGINLKPKHTIINSIENIFINHLNFQVSIENKSLNIEKSIEKILCECLEKYVKYCSNFLIEKLFNEYNMAKMFEFLYAHYFFKSSEIMFVFSKKLFDCINSYESYHEDAILNKLFKESTSSVFTSTGNNLFDSSLVKFKYDDAHNDVNMLTDNQVNKADGFIDSSRLIRSIFISIKITWPLNMIIKKSDFEKYNQFFRLLLQMKQVKYDLNSLDLKGFEFL
jgi:hypothetical protein